MAALLIGAGATLLASVPNLAYATRLAGTPGLFVVRSCAVVGAVRQSHTECTGTFQSDGGTVVDPDATVDQPLTVGADVPMQRTPGGGYDDVGVAAFCGWLAVALFGVAFAGAAVMTALALTGRGRRRAGWLWPLGAVATALMSALVSAIVGALT
ncbi:hypothetical protein GXW82_13285 [Streptacidiphilus sp. 4-A2]|nr:hypothetical protein [Streptacidiphilus sp. 4-A2]